MLSCVYIPGTNKIMFACRNEIVVCDAVTGKQVRSFETPIDMTTWIGWSPNGKILVVAGDKDKIALYDSEEKLMAQLHLESQVHKCIFNPVNNQLLVGTSTCYAVISNLGNGNHIITKKTKARVLSCSVSVDGNYYAIGLESGRVIILDAATLDVLQKYQVDGPVYAMQFGQDNFADEDADAGDDSKQNKNGLENVLAFAGWDEQLHIIRIRDWSDVAIQYKSIQEDKKLTERAVASEREKRISSDNEEHGYISFLPLCLSYCYNYNYLIISGCDGTVSIYNKNGIFLKVIAKLSNEATWITGLALNDRNNASLDDRIIAITSTGRAVSIRTSFSTVHCMCGTIYAFRNMMTNVVVMNLLSLLSRDDSINFSSIKIQMNGHVKRMATCGSKIAVQLTGRIAIIDLKELLRHALNGNMKSSIYDILDTNSQKKPQLVINSIPDDTTFINQDYETGLKAMTENYLIINKSIRDAPQDGKEQGNVYKLAAFDFNGNPVHEWILPAEPLLVKTINNRGLKGLEAESDMKNNECILVGMSNGEVRMYYLNSPECFCRMLKPDPDSRAVKQVDLSPDLKYMAVVFNDQRCSVYRTPSEAVTEEIKHELQLIALEKKAGKDETGLALAESIDYNVPLYTFNNIISVSWNVNHSGILSMTCSGNINQTSGEKNKQASLNGVTTKLVITIGPTPVFMVPANGFLVSFINNMVLLYSSSTNTNLCRLNQNMLTRLIQKSIPLNPLIDNYLHNKKFNEAIELANCTPAGTSLFMWREIATKSLVEAISIAKNESNSRSNSFLDLVNVAKEGFSHLNNFPMLLLLDKLIRTYQATSSSADGFKNNNLIMLIAQCYAYMHDYISALKIYLQYNHISEAVQLLYFAKGQLGTSQAKETLDAELKQYLDKGNEYSTIIHKQSEFLINLGDLEGAADLYMNAGDYENAIGLYQKLNDFDKIASIVNDIPKSKRKVLDKIRGIFEANKMYDKACEISSLLGDINAIIKYEIINNNWSNALLLAANHPHLASNVYSQYGAYLANNGFLEESYVYFRKSNNDKAVLEMLSDMIDTNIMKERFSNVTGLLIKLSTEHIRMIKELALKKSKDNGQSISKSDLLDISEVDVSKLDKEELALLKWHNTIAISSRYKALLYKAYDDIFDLNKKYRSSSTRCVDLPPDTLNKCIFILNYKQYPVWFTNPEINMSEEQTQGEISKIPNLKDNSIWSTSLPLVPPSSVSVSRTIEKYPKNISEKVIYEVIALCCKDGNYGLDGKVTGQIYSKLMQMNNSNTIPSLAQVSPFNSVLERQVEMNCIHLNMKLRLAKQKKRDEDKETIIEQMYTENKTVNSPQEYCPRCKAVLSGLLSAKSTSTFNSEEDVLVTSTFMDRCPMCNMSILRCAVSFRVLPLVEIKCVDKDEDPEAIASALMTPVFNEEAIRRTTDGPQMDQRDDADVLVVKEQEQIRTNNTNTILAPKLGISAEPFISLTLDEMYDIDPFDVFLVEEPVFPFAMALGKEGDYDALSLIGSGKRFFIRVSDNEQIVQCGICGFLFRGDAYFSHSELEKLWQAKDYEHFLIAYTSTAKPAIPDKQLTNILCADALGRLLDNDAQYCLSVILTQQDRGGFMTTFETRCVEKLITALVDNIPTDDRLQYDIPSPVLYAYRTLERVSNKSAATKEKILKKVPKLLNILSSDAPSHVLLGCAYLLNSLVQGDFREESSAQLFKELLDAELASTGNIMTPSQIDGRTVESLTLVKRLFITSSDFLTQLVILEMLYRLWLTATDGTQSSLLSLYLSNILGSVFDTFTSLEPSEFISAAPNMIKQILRETDEEISVFPFEIASLTVCGVTYESCILGNGKNSLCGILQQQGELESANVVKLSGMARIPFVQCTRLQISKSEQTVVLRTTSPTEGEGEPMNGISVIQHWLETIRSNSQPEILPSLTEANYNEESTGSELVFVLRFSERSEFDIFRGRIATNIIKTRSLFRAAEPERYSLAILAEPEEQEAPPQKKQPETTPQATKAPRQRKKAKRRRESPSESEHPKTADLSSSTPSSESIIEKSKAVQKPKAKRNALKLLVENNKRATPGQEKTKPNEKARSFSPSPSNPQFAVESALKTLQETLEKHKQRIDSRYQARAINTLEELVKTYENTIKSRAESIERLSKTRYDELRQQLRLEGRQITSVFKDFVSAIEGAQRQHELTAQDIRDYVKTMRDEIEEAKKQQDRESEKLRHKIEQSRQHLARRLETQREFGAGLARLEQYLVNLEAFE